MCVYLFDFVCIFGCQGAARVAEYARLKKHSTHQRIEYTNQTPGPQQTKPSPNCRQFIACKHFRVAPRVYA